MIDLHELDRHRVFLKSVGWDGDGNHGAFLIRCPKTSRELKIIASSGFGWDHVSVSLNSSTMPPNWTEMEFIRRLFFKPNEAVMQYHAPLADYVDGHNGSGHPGCLHLWRPYDVREGEIPTPPKFMVGGMTPAEASAQADAYMARGLGVRRS